MGVREIPVLRTTEAFSCLGYFPICFPQGGPSHLGDSVAPETVGHMTMRFLAAAESGEVGTFCSLESRLGNSEGLNVEELRYFRRGYRGHILSEPVVWQRRVGVVLCSHLVH